MGDPQRKHAISNQFGTDTTNRAKISRNFGSNSSVLELTDVNTTERQLMACCFPDKVIWARVYSLLQRK